jgi:hypothetical protein
MEDPIVLLVQRRRECILSDLFVLDMEMGCCLGSQENGVSMGGGGEVRPGPPERGK